MTEETPSAQVNRRGRPVALYVGGALAIIAIAALTVALLAGRNKTVVLAPMHPQQPGSAVTQAPAPSAPTGEAVTQAPEPAPAPAGQPAQPPPQEVIDFLNNVGKLEEHRRFLLKDKGPAIALLAGGGDALESFIRQAMDPSLTENVDPFARVRTELSRQLKHWQDVTRSFDSLRPPAACKPFADAYRWVLATEAQQIGRATTALAGASADDKDSMTRSLTALSNMKNDPATQGSIDKAVDASESQLGALCKQYGINKPFSVYRESGTGSLLLP